MQLALARLLVVAFLGLACGWAAAQLPAAEIQALKLSDAERAWVASHGPVKVLVVRGAEPYYSFSDTSGGPLGYGIDMLEVMAARAGLALRYVAADNATAGLKAFDSGEVDMTPLAAPSPRRLGFLSFPGPLLPAERVIISRQDTGDISAQHDFAGRRIAVVAGTVPSETLAAAYPKATFVPFNTPGDAASAVASGEADLAVQWLHDAVYAIESRLLANLRIWREPGAVRSFLGPAVSLKQPLLHDILKRALATLTPAERSQLARRWLPRGTGLSWGNSVVALSPEERDWVERAGEVRLGFDIDFAPFTAGDKQGRFEGLGADTLRLAAQKVGLRVVEQRGGAFGDVYQAALDGPLNLVVGMARNKARLERFDFIGPFSTNPTAIVMRNNDRRLWTDPDDIDGGKLGLTRSHFLIPWLQSRKPGLTLVEFDSLTEVLQALDGGQIDAAAGNSVVLNRLVEQFYTGRLRFTGVVTDGDSELYFGVPKQHPELALILRKGFEAITPAETTELQRRWLLVSLRPGLSPADVLRWAVPLGLATLLVLAVMWAANRRLKSAHAAEVDARSTAERAVAARGRFLAYLSHELRGTLGSIGAGAQMLIDRDDPALRPKLLVTIKRACDNLREMLEATLGHERSLASGIVLQPTEQDLASWWADTLAPLALQAEQKGLSLVDHPPPVNLRLSFDATRLAQVLGNLVQNAIKFTPEGQVAVRGEWDGRRLHIRVADSGPGIPETERERIFEPYSQGAAGRDQRSGAGLGLSICKQIVDTLQGRISVQPGEAGGAVFDVELPLLAGA